MNYIEAVASLDARIRWGMRPGLERIEALMGLLDHPQRGYPSIHVAGTNGKYSVAVMISTILEDLGLRVGTYTSPHLEDVRERITVSGEPIAESDFAEVMAYLLPFIEMVEAQRGDHLTYFETITAMALEWFSDRALHAVVLECGLGGEYDATNVTDAAVAVVTNVSLDHVVEFEGSLEKAAWEKSGVIKPGASVVTGIEQPELLEILRSRAEERGAGPVAVLGEDVHVRDRRIAVGGQLVGVRTVHGDYDELFVPLHGAFQASNVALAVAACEAFAGDALSSDELRSALGRVQVPGRIEVVGRRPLAVIDGGHNPAAAAQVLEAVRESFTYRHLHLVVGMLADKLVESVLALWAHGADRFVVTAPEAERAAEPERLAAGLRDAGVSEERIEVREGLGDALAWTLATAQPDDLVLIFGSFYTAGQARTWLREQGHLPQA